MYSKMEDIVNDSIKRNLKISELIKITMSKEDNISEEEAFEKMKLNYEVMKKAIENGLSKNITSISGLTGGEGSKMWIYSTQCIGGVVIGKAMARAMAVSNVNAAMGKIVAAPTAGSAGILPSAIITAAEVLKKNDDEIINSLFTAAGVGAVIAANATLSGSEGGCQAECGTASAMAAASIVELAGGNQRQVSNAVAIALENTMGLICDPVAGLVEEPCIKRNAVGAVRAIIVADMALSGIKSLIPCDEVIEVMSKVGHMLPCSLKETSLGGIADTPTGRFIKKKLQNILTA